MANDISPCYHPRMYLLPNLVRHNAWANRAVLDAFATAPAVLNTICYDGAPLFARLQHQAGTERAFLDILRVTPKRPEPPSELAAVTSYAAETSTGLLAVTLELGDAAQERLFLFPWWKLELPMHVLVSQMLAHSAQHRSELAWELARAGTNTGELDYIVWTVGGMPEPGVAVNLPDD